MIRKISVDEVTHVMHDLGVNDDYGVKIRMSGNRNPVVLQKGEDDSATMSAKEFLDQVVRCKKVNNDITIVVQEDMEGDKQKAWILEYGEDCDYATRLTCATDATNKTVLLTVFLDEKQ